MLGLWRFPIWVQLLTLPRGLDVGKEIWWLMGRFGAGSDPRLAAGQAGRVRAMGTLPPLLAGAWHCSEYRNLSGLICRCLAEGGMAVHPPALPAASRARCGRARAEARGLQG